MPRPAIHSPTIHLFRVIALLACAIMVGLGLLDMADLTPQNIQQAAAEMNALPMLALQLARLPLVPPALQEGSVLAGLFALLGLLFALAFWLRTSPQLQRPLWLDASLLAAQAVIAVLLDPWTEPGLVYLVAAEFALVLPYRTALACLLAQIGLLEATTVPFLIAFGNGHLHCNVAGALPPPLLALSGMGWLEGMAFQGVAFCVGYFASAEMRSRAALADAHAQLLDAQRHLADAVRTAERGRFAHRLDCVLGERLSALKSQLALAAHEMELQAEESVDTARELAQHLLTEVHAVVAPSHAPHAIDLRQALHTLCNGIPSPRVRLSVEAELDLNAPLLAHTIFRCVQEAVSNAVRHSGAALLQIALRRVHGGIAISIIDNGRGMRSGMAQQALSAGGRGLRGMRERIEELGGQIVPGHATDGGFSLQIWLPQHGAIQ